MISCLLNLGGTAKNTFGKKFTYYKACLAVSFCLIFIGCGKKNTDSGEYSEAFKTVSNFTTHYFDLNQPENAIHYLDKTFAKLHNPTVSDRFRFYGFHYVYWQKAKREYKKAMPYADSMLMMARQSVTRQQYAANFAEANYAKGDTYFSLNRYNDAYQCYFQGYLMGKKYLNQASASDYTYRMGMIMYKQGHYDLAVDYFKESYAKSLLVNDNHGFVWFYRRQEVLDNIGESYTHSGAIDSAIAYFDSALKYVNDNGNRYKVKSLYIDIARGVIYHNKGTALMARKQYTEVEKLLKKSIAINSQKGADNGDAALAQLKLAEVYLSTGKAEESGRMLAGMEGLPDVLKNETVAADWNRLMGKYYQGKKNFAKAIVYFQCYSALKDSAAGKLTLLKESDVNQQLATLEKQYEIDNLNNNNKLQGMYLKAAIACAVMAVAIIFLVWRNWRRTKLDVAVVRMLNGQVSQQKVNLEKALEEVKISSREKDRILRTVAHDLRNPLGGISSLTGLMVEESEHDKVLQGQLILIRETTKDTLELINEIMEATNNNTSAPLNKQAVEINLLLANSVELLRFKAAEKHQQITLHGLVKPTDLYIHREKIGRVISNLIANAIKFSPVGETIEVRSQELDSNICISVADHGIGIPNSMKNKVFNMFTDAKRPGTVGEKSFGLGLSICKQIIEKHNGKIWFESENKKGTTFYITLPKPTAADELPINSQKEMEHHS